MTPPVLIPGLLCDSRLWHHQIDGLKKHESLSAPARFALAGFSLGTQVALEILRLAKERVYRLAPLSATRGGVPTAVEAAIRRAVAIEAAYPTHFAASRLEIRACDNASWIWRVPSDAVPGYYQLAEIGVQYLLLTRAAQQ